MIILRLPYKIFHLRLRMKSNLEDDSSQIGTYMVPPNVEAYKHLKKYG